VVGCVRQLRAGHEGGISHPAITSTSCTTTTRLERSASFALLAFVAQPAAQRRVYRFLLRLLWCAYMRIHMHTHVHTHKHTHTHTHEEREDEEEEKRKKTTTRERERKRERDIQEERKKERKKEREREREEGSTRRRRRITYRVVATPPPHTRE
jgi:alpha-galactosidase/6-phospho-beta-glucosidase family protein